MGVVMKTISLVHKDTIRSGDIIICSDGIERTVCNNNIKYDSFMGVSIFGDSYRNGHQLVTKVTYTRAMPKHMTK